MVLGIILANHVGPAEYGVWGLIAVFMMYAQYGHLGAVFAMQRELPIAMAQRRTADVERLAASALGLFVACGLGLAMIVVVVVVFVQSGLSPIARLSFWLLPPLLFGQMLYAFVYNYFRSLQRFPEAATAIMFQSVILLSASLALIWRWGVAGFAGAWIASFFVSVLLCAARMAVPVIPSWSRKDWVFLIRTGVPLMALSMMFVFLTGVDRLVIAPFLGIEDVGHYTVSLLPFALGVLGCELFSETLYPRLAEVYGRTKSVRSTFDSFLTPWKGLCYLLPLAQGVAILLIPPVLRWLLPAYNSAIVPAQILVASVSFFGLGQLSAYVFSVVREEKMPIRVQAAILLVKVVFLVGALTVSKSLEAVALASAGASTLYGVAMTLWLGSRMASRCRILGYLTLPWAVGTALVGLSIGFSSLTPVTSSVGRAVAGVAVYLGLAAAVLRLTRRGWENVTNFSYWTRHREAQALDSASS